MTEIVVEQKRAELPPVDPDAQIPESVKNRAAAVDAFYAQQQTTNQSDSAVEQPPTPPPEQAQADSLPPAPPSEPEPPQDEQRPVDWRRQYNAMRGRFESAQRTIAEQQQQMEQLGNELLQTQQHAPPAPLPRTPTYLTEQDVRNYGNDLIDFTQRAAAQYVVPHLQRLEAEKEQLRQRLAYEERQRLDQAVAQAVPNWQEIDNHPRWHQWLRLPDLLSGRIRQSLLDEAIRAANAPRVIQFFNQFLNEERATGNMEAAVASPPPQSAREPAVSMLSLASPGRARPASGGSEASVPPDKPTYTRAQIAANYRLHQRGAWNGRDSEWNRLEHDMFAAQREGRVR